MPLPLPNVSALRSALVVFKTRSIPHPTPLHSCPPSTAPHCPTFSPCSAPTPSPPHSLPRPRSTFTKATSTRSRPAHGHASFSSTRRGTAPADLRAKRCSRSGDTCTSHTWRTRFTCLLVTSSESMFRLRVNTSGLLYLTTRNLNLLTFCGYLSDFDSCC